MFRLHRRAVSMFLLCCCLTPCLADQAVSRAAGGPYLTVAPNPSGPGAVVLVTGQGFPAGSRLDLDLDGRRQVMVAVPSGGILPVTGLVIPPLIAPGAHQVSVRDARGTVLAQTTLDIHALAPLLRVLGAAVAPGARVRVWGSGFLPGEQIALALNGAALHVLAAGSGHSDLISGPDGQFSAAFIAPADLVAGANTISAAGSQSRQTVTATLLANLPPRSRFLFAGTTTSGARAVLALLNPGTPRADVHLVIFPSGGEQPLRTTAAFTVPPFRRASIDLTPLVGPNRRFGLLLVADRAVSAQLLQMSPTSLWTVTPAASARTSWLLAEGFTGLTFHETLAFLNPGRLPAHAHLRLLPAAGRAARVLNVTVPGGRELLLDVNALAPRSSVAAEVGADQPIVVSRTLRFGQDGRGVTTTLGSPIASTTWLFAEGSTAGGVQTYLTVLNPGDARAAVTASFYDQRGRPLGNHTLLIGPLQRATLRINDVLHVADFATYVTASTPVVVERPMYLGSPNGPSPTGSDVPGSNGPALEASFAAGQSGPGYHEQILLLNPTARPARLRLVLFPPAGARWTKPISREVDVPPLARQTVAIGALLAGEPAGAHAVTLQSLNGVGFVAEQSIYLHRAGRVSLESAPAFGA